MESLIEKFVSTGDGNGDGDGDGNGYGDGYGNGGGYGYGNGGGYGDGGGNGNGGGSGYGGGYGYGNGYGDGYGNGGGYGYGYGNGGGVQEIDGHKVYNIDGIPTIIESVHGSYAKGYILRNNVELVPCYIAKMGWSFAHGERLYQARRDAEAKYNESLPLEQRISHIASKYPSLDTMVSNGELFKLHHLLTGSCEFGRRQFCEQHGINLDGFMSMREFIGLTKDAYGGEAISQLERAYNDEITTK